MATRQVFIDTETTGLSAKAGHRIVEIAAIEVIDQKLTGRKFHTYLNPDRSIDPHAQKVHGLNSDFLKDKPTFRQVANEFIEFVRGAECLMHNALFDSGFINAELSQAERNETLEGLGPVTCTVSLAKRMFPGESVKLDALIPKSGLSTKRKQHSALEDAELLALVYLKLLNGTTTKGPTKMTRTTNNLPSLLPFLAPCFEHYITLERVNPSRTYDYKSRNMFNLPVFESTVHRPKCSIGESWTYLAIPRGARIELLGSNERLYVGAQTQDRMFRGDGLRGENFHHAQMRSGNKSDTPEALLKAGEKIEIHRVRARDFIDVVMNSAELIKLKPLLSQPVKSKTHIGYWCEQYILHSEAGQWRWNTQPAEEDIARILLNH